MRPSPSLATRLRALVAALLLCGPAAAQETLDVLTYNVWHGRVRTERREWLAFPGESRRHRSRRLGDQLELIRSTDAALVLLQEVPQPARSARRYARELGYDEVHQSTACGLRLFGLGVPLNVHSGLVILAHRRLGLRRRGSVRLSGRLSVCTDWLGLQLEEGRYALLADIVAGDAGAGERILVVNTHLHHGDGPSRSLRRLLDGMTSAGELSEPRRARMEEAMAAAERRRVDEVEALIAAISRARSGDAAPAAIAGVVVGGDLNATPGSPPITRLALEGFVDAAERAAAGSDVAAPPTYDPASNPLAAWVGARSAPSIPTFGDPRLADRVRREGLREPRRIDYVLVSKELAGGVSGVSRVGLAPASDRAGREGAPPPPPMLSDHYGVLARLVAP